MLSGGDRNRHVPQSIHPKFPSRGPVESHGTPNLHACTNLRTIRKRSFARMQKRLMLHGFSIYKGRIYTSIPVDSPSKTPVVPTGKPTRSKARRRLSHLSWNCCSLTTAAFSELLIWLSIQSVDLVFLQATRWTLEQPWSSHGYHIVPSASAARDNAGLLTLISSRVCTKDDISFSDPWPGRLQLIKCKTPWGTIDLINFYQFTTQSTQGRPAPFEARRKLWDALEQQIRSAPYRNVLVLGGDFNTSLERSSASSFQDVGTFRNLISDFGLTSLRVHDASPTFIGPRGSSRIDFVFMRRAQADRQAHGSFCLTSFPLLQARAFPDHVPILSSIPVDWKVWYNPKQKPCVTLTKQDLQLIDHHYRANSQSWQDFQTKIHDSLASDQALDVQFPVRQIMHLSKNMFSCAPTNKLPLWMKESTRSLVAQKWKHLHLARQGLGDTMPLSKCFHVWFHVSRFFRCHRLLAKHCTEQKKERFRSITADAARAAAAHDTRALYQAIRLLTPKQVRRMVRFRGSVGEPMLAEQELHHMERHFAPIFQTSEAPTTTDTCTPVLLTEAELVFQLAQTKKYKAVAPSTIPALLIRALAPALGDWLHRYLQQSWRTAPCIPQMWKDATLALLPKRQVLTPGDLRPIALTCGLGKAVLGGYVRRIHQELYPRMCQLPLVAYLPHRGVLDALLIIFDFCDHVRSACKQLAPGPWRLRPAPKDCLRGGLILSLDLKQAPDRLPRPQLAQGLHLCGCPPELSTVLMHWLEGARYAIAHRGHKLQILTTRGVRQGCKASPLEWNAFMVFLLECLEHDLYDRMPHVAPGWILRHLLVYADDILGRWMLEKPEDLTTALTQIGMLLDLLEHHGLSISQEKTVLLLKLAGASSKSILKRLFVHQQGHRWIKIPRRGEPTLLKVVDSHTYLGVKISFNTFEQQTLKYRMQLSQTTNLRLKKWLCGRNGLTTRDRLHLWQTCVQTSLCHGLCSAGLRQDGLQQLTHRLSADIRRVARSPAHITHETTADLCAPLHIPAPMRLLQDSWLGTFRRLRSTRVSLDPTDFLWILDLDKVQQRVMKVFEALPKSTPQDTDAVFSCPYCAHVSTTQSTLNRHLSKKHKTKGLFERFETLRDSLGGRPQCCHCHRKLASWRGLVTHIQQGHCSTFDLALAWQVAPADQEELRDYARKQAWQALVENLTLIQVIREQCILCGRFFANGKELLQHVHRMHQALWAASMHYTAEIMHFLRGLKACSACGKDVNVAHSCHAVRQMAILKVLVKSDITTAEADTGTVLVVPPPVPNPDLPLPEASKRRKLNGRITKAEFQPGRDSADGTPTCAHCHAVLQNHFGLKSHIEGGCRSFHADRPLGSHVPMGWSKLQALILDLDIDNILADNDYLTALQARCVLCGRLSSKPGGVLQHLQQEHQELLSLSRDLEDRLQNEALASGRQCKCGNKYTKRGHKCMIYAQLAVLYHALQPRSVAPSVSADMQVSAPSTSEPTTFWTRESWRTWLSTTCSVCQTKVELEQLHQHLQQVHAHTYAEALGQLERCTSPNLFCCNFCLKSEEIVDCPVALNLAYHILLHADDRIWSGRTDGSDRGHLRLNASGGRKAAGSQENQRADGKPTRDIRSLLLGAHRPSSAAPDDPDTSSGGLHPVPSDHRHVPDVLAVCTVGHRPAVDEEITGMEAIHGEPNGQTGLEECAISNHRATTPRPIPQDCHLESRIRDLERGYHPSGDHGTRVMALLGVESKGETPGSHGQDRSFYDHHAEPDRGAGGDSIAGGVGPQAQVPQTGKQGWGETSGQPLVTAVASQEGENPRDPDAFDRFLNMVSSHGQGQTTHQQGESCRGPADQSVQQPVQAEALAGWLLPYG